MAFIQCSSAHPVRCDQPASGLFQGIAPCVPQASARLSMQGQLQLSRVRARGLLWVLWACRAGDGRAGSDHLSPGPSAGYL
eukprot:3286792-Pyramimonas_sp.AAC.1